MKKVYESKVLIEILQGAYISERYKYEVISNKKGMSFINVFFREENIISEENGRLIFMESVSNIKKRLNIENIESFLDDFTRTYLKMYMGENHFSYYALANAYSLDGNLKIVVNTDILEIA